jgi:hypothetical protein
MTAELTQAEKRAALLNDARVREQQQKQSEPPATLHAFAMAEIAAERQGRHAAVTPSTVVVGSTETTRYPGAGQEDPVGQEPPLGFDLSAAPIVGEPHEIAASIAALDVSSPEQSPAQVPGGPTAPSNLIVASSVGPPSSQTKG